MRKIQISTQILPFPHDISRKDKVVLTRLRIGHTLLTHKHLFDREPAPTCQQCNCLLSIEHIFDQCPIYQRAKILYSINSIKDLTDKYKPCLQFIKESEIYTKI